MSVNVSNYLVSYTRPSLDVTQPSTSTAVVIVLVVGQKLSHTLHGTQCLIGVPANVSALMSIAINADIFVTFS